MILRAAAEALPLLTGARRVVLAVEGLPEAGALALDGLDVWIAAQRGAVTLLHPAGAPAPDEAGAVDLPAPPAALLAVVTTERAAVEDLLDGCAQGSGLPAPPLLIAADGVAALPALAAELASALVAAEARESALDGALTVLRLELEETRIAAADMARRLAHLPPRPLRLVLDGEAGDPAPAEDGARRAELGVMLAGLAAVAIHVAAVPEGRGTLRLRLIGGESGRVAGSWLAHRASLSPGWLTLDLPTPLGPLRESAVLEVSTTGDAPTLSLDARWSGPDGEHALAVRAWSGEPGARHVLPRFWDPEEIGLGRPVPGVPHALPAGAWQTARVLAGEAPLAAMGDEAPRAVLHAAPGGRAVLLLPHLHAPGMDRAQVSLTPTGPPGARAALWALPAGTDLTDDAVLDRPDSPASGTGWRDLPEDGATLTVALPDAAGGRLQLVIGLRAAEGDAAVAEVSAVTLHASAPDVPLPSLGAETDPPVPTPAPAPDTPLDAPPEPPPPVAPSIAVDPSTDPGLAPPPVPAPFPAARPAPAPIGLAPPPMSQPLPTSRSFAAWSPRPPAGAPRPVALPPIRPVMVPEPVPARPMAEADPGAPASPSPAATAKPAAPPPWRAPTVPPPAPPPLSAWSSAGRGVATRAPVLARHEAVRLHQHLPGDSYEHLDLSVVSLSRGTQRWSTVRVKLAMKDGDPRLEFRRAAGWPTMFQDWLGTGSDRFGPFLRITLAELPEFLGRVTDERDAALMQALLAVLPQAGESAAREANLPPPAVARWAEAARQLQAAGKPPG